MTDARTILILGGTGEARSLATRLAKIPALKVITSLAGATERPARPPGLVRIGGFGGIEGLAAYLEEANVGLVVDATHPFAATISKHALAACAQSDTPLLRLERPAWKAREEDRWIEVADCAAAAAALADLSDRVFLTVGRKELSAFASLSETWFLVRFIEPAKERLPLACCETIVSRPPFHLAAEKALLWARKIGALVSKNSGGNATYSKIEAARDLGLPVVMIGRPEPPKTEHVANSVAKALEMIKEALD